MTGRGRGGSHQTRQISLEPTERLLKHPPSHYNKLKGQENWQSWKMLMLIFFESERLHSYLTTRTADEDLDDPESVRGREDAHVRLCLASCLEDNLMRLIANSRRRASDMWMALCVNFENQGVQRRLTLLYKFLDTKRSGYASLLEFINSVHETFELLNGDGAESLNDEVAAAIVLRNLRPEDEMIKRFAEQSCTVTNAAQDSVLSFSLVIQKLRLEAQKEAAEAATENSSTALKAFQGNKGQQSGRNLHRGRGRGGRGGYRGHGSRGANHNTFQRGNEQQRSSTGSNDSYPLCRWCRKTTETHTEENCWFKEGRKRKEQKARQDGGKDKRGRPGPGRWALKTTESSESRDGSAKMAKRSPAEALMASLETDQNA